MSFVDKVTVTAIAGKGGDGKLSFRRERFVAKGGPDGGDGGKGGDVILEASHSQNTLAAFRYKKELKAEAGQTGGKSRKHGKSGKNLIVAVPVGTVANKDGKVIADLVESGQQAVIARGGKGGFGNAHFVSSRRQAPNFAEKGELGELWQLELELKMIADVGLIGLPNAGKSTLLSKITNAHPEIGDYPFTTIRPNLGVVDIDKNFSVLMADIPGLIEGAAAGKGLGHDFLRHIERTKVILHLVDAYSPDVAKEYITVRDELHAYKPALTRRPEIVALTKVEGLDDEIVADLMGQIKSVTKKTTPVLTVSSKAGIGLKELLFILKKRVIATKTKTIKQSKPSPLPVIKLTDTSKAFKVTKRGKTFIVKGEQIEKFAARTDFNNYEATQRLRDIMRRSGILQELNRRGIKAGQTIKIGSSGSFRY